MTLPDDQKRRPRPVNGLRWFFEDRRTGRIVIGQVPNWPLWIFVVTWGIETFAHPGGLFGTVVRVAKIASLTIWALDEIIRGVNPWRRTLGCAVLLLEIVGWLKP